MLLYPKIHTLGTVDRTHQKPETAPLLFFLDDASYYTLSIFYDKRHPCSISLSVSLVHVVDTLLPSLDGSCTIVYGSLDGLASIASRDFFYSHAPVYST